MLAGCGGSATPASSIAASSVAAKPASAAPATAAASVKPAAAASSVPTKPSASGPAAAKPAASGSAAAKPAATPTFTDGTVASTDATKLTLAEGNKAFTLAPTTSYVKLEKETPADVKPGQFVAITAKLQPDSTLLASALRLQDSSGGRPANQYPMGQFSNGHSVRGNLIVQIVHQASGSASDLKLGVRVTVLSRDDAALNMGGYV